MAPILLEPGGALSHLRYMGPAPPWGPFWSLGPAETPPLTNFLLAGSPL